MPVVEVVPSVRPLESRTPPCVLQLSFGGRAAMENLESGSRYSGKASAQAGMLVTIWDSNRSKTTYDINSASAM